MTVLEALKESINTLNGISVPVAMIQQIGVPVQRAVALIQASADALEKSAQEQAQEPGAEPEEGAEDDDERTDV